MRKDAHRIAKQGVQSNMSNMNNKIISAAKYELFGNTLYNLFSNKKIICY